MADQRLGDLEMASYEAYMKLNETAPHFERKAT